MIQHVTDEERKLAVALAIALSDTARLDFLERQCQQEEFLTDGMTLRMHIDKQMGRER